MKVVRWITLLLKFLGLIKEAEELATGSSDQKPEAPLAVSGKPRDETDKDDRFHLNQ